jgi:hypothetical protein
MSFFSDAAGRALVIAAAIFAAALSSRAVAQEAAEIEVLQLRLVPIKQGHVESAFGRDAARFRATEAYRAADAAGVIIDPPSHPLVVHSLKDARLYFLFYNTLENAFGPASYLIQRIKKTERNYSDANDETPETKITRLVEAIKLQPTAMPPDQHFGSYALGRFFRREIVKEFEIGFGEIESVATGADWPFEAGTRFKQIHDYIEDPATYDNVRFSRSRVWTLRVSFDRDGNYSVQVPELDIDAPTALPGLEAVTVKPAPGSRELILEEGRGVSGLRLAESRAEDIERVFGAPLHVMRASASANNYIHRQGLTFNVTINGAINTIFTTPAFAGKTSKGIALGDARDRVMEAYGNPLRSFGQTASYPGVFFYFDAEDRVSRIVLARTQASATPSSRPAQAPHPPQAAYEYKVLSESEIAALSPQTDDPFEAGLNRLGADGWQLLATRNASSGQPERFIFMRRRTAEPTNANPRR